MTATSSRFGEYLQETCTEFNEYYQTEFVLTREETSNTYIIRGKYLSLSTRLDDEMARWHLNDEAQELFKEEIDLDHLFHRETMFVCNMALGIRVSFAVMEESLAIAPPQGNA